MGAFQLAWSQGYEYIWIDSCCINKDSSAGLSEALNSMFQYYENSEVCYVYLPDVPNADSGDPYLSGSKCLGFGRIVRSFPNGESVTLAVLKTSDKSLWNIHLKVSQTPRLTLPKRLLKRPNSGFLKHGPDIYVSVDDKTPHRGLIFISQSTSRDLNILNVSNILVVLLGIQDAKAWSIVGGDSTSEPRLSAERIYEELIDDDKKLFWDDGRITNTSEKLYFAGEDSEEYCLAVLRMSQNTTLQPGTHCVKIEFQSTRIPRYPYS
ncbi:hypothetical protein D9758_011602 [Tetrapyrgos nigripes]|uniref:Heterokaryon incompatibility domain-containing protein n=1 Tax=Tetrapyrgos nigripes TaxID=182062 RepID=A0A8H5CN91_9AGAR|nr:hypothetical protein D9758_011602 [Tetrapyrgos nigripes]